MRKPTGAGLLSMTVGGGLLVRRRPVGGGRWESFSVCFHNLVIYRMCCHTLFAYW